jgi:DNA-binding transcriptional LysR family regulator
MRDHAERGASVEAAAGQARVAVGLSFKFLAKGPLIAVLPADHRLTSRKKIRPQDLAREIYVSSARISPVLKSVIQDYASKVGITLKAEYEGDNLPSAMSLVVSTGGVTLIPLYAQNMLTPNVVKSCMNAVFWVSGFRPMARPSRRSISPTAACPGFVLLWAPTLVSAASPCRTKKAISTLP